MALKSAACQGGGTDLQHQSVRPAKPAQSGQQFWGKRSIPGGHWAVFNPILGELPGPQSLEPLGLGQVQHLSVESVGLPSKTALFPFSQAGQQAGATDGGTSSLFQESLGLLPLPSSCLVVVQLFV